MISKKVLFGSAMCPGCVVMKKELEDRNIKFLYLDINENLANLKKFLTLRERPEFDDAKANGYIGIPALVINDGERIIFEGESLDNL